ncbi:MAG: NAD-dependent epimerase/dehydratase family protein [Solirubrobacterales bacterium]
MITEVIRQDARSVVGRLGALIEPLAGSSVVVTGAAGFLGAFFLDVLDAFNDAHPGRPARIVALDNFLVGLPERIAHLQARAWISCRAADIAKPVSVGMTPDWIIHCASIGSPAISRANPLETIAANVQGTWNMLELAHAGAKGMLSFSSSEVYGAAETVPTPEDYRGIAGFTGARAYYEESKRLGETLCATYVGLHRTPVTVVRPFDVYGPGQRLDDGRIIPDLMRAALAGGPLVLFADPDERRSFCYVSDFAVACLTLLMMPEADGEAFNVGHPDDVRLAEAAHTLAALASDPPLAVELRGAQDGLPARRHCPDLAKLERMTGFAATVPLAEGLARTLASYREERDHMSLRRARA